jgi:hypothetical protein
VHQLVDEVRLVLQRHGVEYDALSPDELRIHHGSAEVQLACQTGARSIVSLSSEVLSECHIPEGGHLRALRSLNDRNRSLSFGKFFYDAESRTIVLRYDLLAEHMQDEELLHALFAVAQTADDHDDLLQSELGTGLRASERSGREPSAHSL